MGKYTTEGGSASVIIDNLVVGYHVWADNSHIALFVLGKDSLPNTLHYLQLPTKRDTIIAENIGRSLHKVPGERAISFIHKVSEKEWWIKKLNTETLAMEKIATTLSGREDIVWTPEGILLSSNGVKLFKLEENDWKEISFNSGSMPLKGITRLAISNDGKKIVVVASE